MLLQDLIRDVDVPPGLVVSGISEDSRRIREGDLFCALTGANFDGRAYIDDAVRQGAVAVLCEPPPVTAPVPVITLENLSGQLGPLASAIYGNPSSATTVVAVTGTNGKTSFTHLLAQALAADGARAGVVGTMGHGFPGELTDPGLTTPAPTDLQRRIRELVDRNCAAVVLEASSHGLAQGRLAGVDVDTAVFTNLSHDHLDYHDTLDDYRDAKAILFEMGSLRHAVINRDDDAFAVMASKLHESVRLVAFSREDAAADVYCDEVETTATGLRLSITIGLERVQCDLPLYGLFNVENVLAVAATLLAMDVAADRIERALQALTPVAGRMDVVTRAGMPILFVDYAHTPDALEKCLLAARQHFPTRKIVCVFGCGGDRDRAKRPMMGQIASSLADSVVLTSDNPRSESPGAIIEEILAGVTAADVVVREDRQQGIEAAIAAADAEDVVIVAGKGHEDYQELATGRIPFSDYAVIEAALARWNERHGRED
jgi:UDP-N-acetylmuramoyl-L-alanyl-D-glutamate--2,6-diaminopimelate ligase